MKIYNTLTREKNKFIPLKKGRVSMYVCGPTVYDEPHIGHARSAYIFNVIRRYLEYKGLKVMFVRNVTDIDDKIITRARKELGENLEPLAVKVKTREISEKYLKAYTEDMSLLGIDKPDKEPKATEYIPKMIKFIQLIMEKGFAYEAGGDVYFDVKKAKKYGKLSGQNVENMEIGARISPGETKKNPLDFALWKKAKPEEPSWESPWGKGRPGWHIECSVMSSDILGGEFDIHGGGVDLVFPHHENEIAQSEAAGNKFARIWMHNGLLTISGEKMAKSLGNYVSIKDFIREYKDSDLLKLLFVTSHYKSSVDYSEHKIREMASMKERILIFLQKAEDTRKTKSKKTKSPKTTGRSKIKELNDSFEKAMDDDFNTAEAVAIIFEAVTAGNRFLSEGNTRLADEIRKLVRELSLIFGLNLKEGREAEESLKDEVEHLIKERNAARKKRDFKKADEIRLSLSKKGIILEDTKEGTAWRRKL